MRNKICLLGTKDILGFLTILSKIEGGKIEVFNPKLGYRVDARSILGLTMAATEWSGDTWIESEEDIYDLIEQYIVITDDDAAYIHE